MGEVGREEKCEGGAGRVDVLYDFGGKGGTWYQHAGLSGFL